MTDKRLLCVASLVREGASLADIGTDHAYLPVYLMQEGRIRAAIAADIGEGPAASARQHIREAALDEAIAVRVCDGLVGIAPDEVTDIVIAGMGGETIIHILSEAPWVRDARYRLVLQPMTKTVELRRWLYDNGFTVTEEHLIPDGRHLYNVMAAEFAAASPAADPLMPYIGALSAKEGLPYFQRQLETLQKRIGGMKLAGNTAEVAALEELYAALTRYIDTAKEREA